MNGGHQPVLLHEAIEALGCQLGGTYVDATIGAGGHAAAILEHIGPEGRLIGIDLDAEALAQARERLATFGQQVELHQGDFCDLDTVLEARGIDALDGILFDLGLSSMQIEAAERGFSFRRDGPLDMRMDRRETFTAADLVNGADERELGRIVRDWGEERWWKRIARGLVEARRTAPITSTGRLAEVVVAAIPARARRQRIHPATRTFQALRIAVNRELERLARALPTAVGLLKEAARCVVIAYHSLEDRIVKQTFATMARGCLCPPGLPECRCGHHPEVRLLTRRPLRAGPQEVESNPRARSARLRACEKLAIT